MFSPMDLGWKKYSPLFVDWFNHSFPVSEGKDKSGRRRMMCKIHGRHPKGTCPSCLRVKIHDLKKENESLRKIIEGMGNEGDR